MSRADRKFYPKRPNQRRFKMSLAGRISLVTGASKGIGKGVACQLGQAGSTVYITGRSVDKLAECAEIIQNRGGKAISVPTGALPYNIFDSN